jgi:hypothetical protein
MLFNLPIEIVSLCFEYAGFITCVLNDFDASIIEKSFNESCIEEYIKTKNEKVILWILKNKKEIIKNFIDEDIKELLIKHDIIQDFNVDFISHKDYVKFAIKFNSLKSLKWIIENNKGFIMEDLLTYYFHFYNVQDLKILKILSDFTTYKLKKENEEDVDVIFKKHLGSNYNCRNFTIKEIDWDFYYNNYNIVKIFK